MTLSIRARLLMWVIGGTALLLTAFALVVYVVMYRSLVDASRAATGTHCGLGLALVQRAVNLLGGNVCASVEDGVFNIHLSLPSSPTAYCGT